MAGGADIALKLRGVKAILFDVDGVLTDGRIVLGPGGSETKFFDAKDGHRIRMAGRGGLAVFFITGRRSEAVESRGKELGVSGIYQSVNDKLPLLEEISRVSGVSAGEMAYMGDDLVDLPVMRSVGLSACPDDAAEEVLAAADLVIDRRGGRGAAGRLIEVVLKAQGKWEVLLRKYAENNG